MSGQHELQLPLQKLVDIHKSLPSEHITAIDASNQGFSQNYTHAIPIKRAIVRMMADLSSLLASEHAFNCLRELPRPNIKEAIAYCLELTELLNSSLEKIRANSEWSQEFWRAERSAVVDLTDKLRIALEPALGRYFAINNSVNAAANLTLEIQSARETITQLANDGRKIEDELKKQSAILALTNYIQDCKNAIREHVVGARVAAMVFVILVLFLNYVVFWLLSVSPFLGFGPVPPKLPTDNNAWLFVTYILSKVLIVGVTAISPLVACRLYLTHQHNIVTLRHQKLSFQAMLDLLKTLSIEDTIIRAKVAEQGIQAICNRETSGFLKADVDVSTYSAVAEKILKIAGK